MLCERHDKLGLRGTAGQGVDIEAAEDRRLVHAAPPQLAVTVRVELDGTAILQTSGVDMAVRCSGPLTPSTTSTAMSSPDARVTSP